MCKTIASVCYEILSFAFGLNVCVSSLTWFKLVFAIQVVASQDLPEVKLYNARVAALPSILLLEWRLLTPDQ
ncbi:hypothetical protein FEM48_Zijuj05G0136400 [Ziziphus jujuba var. spinosa]|uniref:Uncharacterized protein n=1 Tax=Ziziphus jujuba var. spinosa TaxID=714518 RepID=A0A978VF55_ZIZJJ|nr:hypothetical protein FEM48_Zijuj05G0136400 [Ziziphus jujuba var. spinosa]